MRPPSVRSVLVSAALTAMVAAGAACSETPATSPAGPAPGSPAAGTTASGGRVPFNGFREITVTIVDEQGRVRTYCLLLADTPALRERGLMHVTDAGLGGYDGMAFLFDEDDDGGFWMRNTRLPLSIAWFRADGTLVSTADMEPCPDEASTCPTYPPAGAYRFAIEVPQGRLDDLGISERARVSLGERACAPASADP